MKLMSLLKWSLAFSLLFLALSVSKSDPDYFFTASTFSTVLSVSLSAIQAHCSFIVIESDLPILSSPWIGQSKSPKKPFSQYRSKNKTPSTKYSSTHCLLVQVSPHIRFQNAFILFSTSLAELPSSFFLKFHSSSSFSLDIDAIGQIPLVEYQELIRPKTEPEAKKIYPSFGRKDNYMPFKPGYGLSKERYPEGMMWILTLPRSGTHLIKEMLELILEEYTIVFPQPIFNPPQLKQERFFVNARFSISHYAFNELLTSRMILVYRNPVAQADSFFHQTVNRIIRCHETNKAKEGYHKVSAFLDFMKNGVLFVRNFNREHFYLPLAKYFVRFEDLIYRPEDLFCEMLSFMNAFPCEYSHKAKVKEILQRENLKSGYKQEKPKESPVDSLEIFQKMGKEIVRLFWENTEVREWIYFMDYQDDFVEFLNVPHKRTKTVIEEDGNFRDSNQKTFHEVLFYKHEYRTLIDEDLISGIDPTPVIAREIILNEEFDPYRICQTRETPFIGEPLPEGAFQRPKKPKQTIDLTRKMPEPPTPQQIKQMYKFKPKNRQKIPGEPVGYEKNQGKMPLNYRK